MLAPTGVGILWGKTAILEKVTASKPIETHNKQ